MSQCQHLRLTVYLESAALQLKGKAFIHVCCDDCEMELAHWLMHPSNESFAYLKTIKKGVKTLNDLTGLGLNESLEIMSPMAARLEQNVIGGLGQLKLVELSAYERKQLIAYWQSGVEWLSEPHEPSEKDEIIAPF